MKRRILMMLLATMIAVTGSMAQSVSLKQKDISVSQAIALLKQQTGYSFVYEAADLDTQRRVSLDATTLRTAVEQILAGQNVGYEIKGKNIVVRRHRTAEPSKPQPSAPPAPTRKVKVTGLVLYADDEEPVAGATIRVKGVPGALAVSDVDGRFSIDVPEGRRLTVSSVGMQTATVAPQEQLTVRLVADNQLEEVVVTGMQKMDKRLFTGAAVRLAMDEVKLDGVPDISRSLEGRAAGVSVQNITGTFGTAPKIHVRGATSIYGNSTPLWVVDGIIQDEVIEVSTSQLSSGDAVTLISSAVANLNADDIESFQILKDGSATSIYGARGMAGVIVVTTKKGSRQKARVGYNGEFTTRLKPSYHDFNIMNSQEQMGFYREMQQKGWLNYSDTHRAASSGVYGKMYELMNTYNPTTGRFLIDNTAEGRALYLMQAEYRNTDWFDELFSMAPQMNHSVSIASGNERMQTYTALSAMTDGGWYKDSRVERYTVHLNATYDIFQNLRLNLIGTAAFRKQKAPGTLNQQTDPFYGEVSRDFDINPYSYAINASRTLDPAEHYRRYFTSFNILDELDNNYMNVDMADVKAQAQLDYRPVQGLELSALGSVRYTNSDMEHIIHDNSNQAGAYRAMPDIYSLSRNPFLYDDETQPYSIPTTILPKGGIYQKTTYKMRSYYGRVSALYSHLFGERHLINLFGGAEAQSQTRNDTWFNGWGMLYTIGEVPFYVGDAAQKSIQENDPYYTLKNTVTRSAAFFANATYSYDNRYILNTTARYDGTNRLGKARQSRWLGTWNVSGAWNASEERFWKPVLPIVSHASLKLSYSLTGDPGPANVTNALADIRYYTAYRPTQNTQETGLKIQELANSELTYEKKHELNVGLDLGFLNNRISLAADFYRRNNYDLIGMIQTQGVGGQMLKLANVASMKSGGVEFSLQTTNIQTEKFKWTTSLIFSHATTKVTKLKTKAEVMELIVGEGFAVEGYPARGLFSFRSEGLNSIGIPQLVNQDGQLTSNGFRFDLRSQQLDNLVYEGPTDPTYTGSLGNILRYGHFRLNLFLTYAFGNVVRLDPVFRTQYSDLDALPKEMQDRWVLAGDEQRTRIPVMLSTEQVKEDPYLRKLYNVYNYSTDRVAKGDFIRLKEVSLYYDFPHEWVSHLRLSNLSLKLQATNLLLLYSDKKLNGQDPEFFRSGGVSAPMARQFTLTLNLGV